MTGAWSEGMADEEAVRSRRRRHTRIRLFGMGIDMGVPERRILLPVMEDGPIGIGYGYPRSMGNGHYETGVPFLTPDASTQLPWLNSGTPFRKKVLRPRLWRTWGYWNPIRIRFIFRHALGWAAAFRLAFAMADAGCRSAPAVTG